MNEDFLRIIYYILMIWTQTGYCMAIADKADPSEDSSSQTNDRLISKQKKTLRLEKIMTKGMRRCCELGRQRRQDRTCNIDDMISEETVKRDGIWRRIKLKTNSETNLSLKLEEKAGAKVRRLKRCKRSGSGSVMFKRCCNQSDPT